MPKHVDPSFCAASPSQAPTSHQALAASTSRKRVYETRRYCFARTRMTLFGDFRDAQAIQRADACWDATLEVLRRVHSCANLGDPSSTLSRFNALGPDESLEADGLTGALVAEALRARDYTCGAYDPAAYALVDLWGFSPRTYRQPAAPDRPQAKEAPALPDSQAIEALRQLMGPESVAVAAHGDGCILTKGDRAATVGGAPRVVQLDLGGIAKGFAVDCAADLMGAYGFTRASCSCESSIALLGGEGAPGSSDAPFTVYLTDPDSPAEQPRSFMLLKTGGTCVSTSGGYGRGYEVGGLRYTHVIDLATGWPVRYPTAEADAKTPAFPEVAPPAQKAADEVVALTLLGPEATLGDALATALVALGRQQALAFYRERLAPDWGIVLVGPAVDGVHTVTTSLPPSRYRLLSPRFQAQGV